MRCYNTLELNGRSPIEEVMMNYKVVLESQPEGGYTAYVPTLPGCVSQGETREQAMVNIREAIDLYLESLRVRNISPPEIEEREVVV